MEVGSCKPCLTDNVALHKSHIMPAALYRGGAGKKFDVIPYSGISETDVETKQPRLCHDCEQRLDQGGETRVLEVINPKSGDVFRLSQLMNTAYAREGDGTLSRFYGPVLRDNSNTTTSSKLQEHVARL